MNRKPLWIAMCAVLLCCQLVSSASAISNGEKFKASGLIVGRDGETFTMRTLDAGNVVVILTERTKVVQPKGILKLRKAEMGMTALMPGLKVEVEGVGAPDNRVMANSVKFSGDDLKTAEAIQAGLVPTNEAVQTNKDNIQTNKDNIAANKDDIAANKVQIASNKEQIDTNQKDIQDVNKRFSDLAEYDVKYSATVLFATGSSSISSKDKDALAQLARDATGQKGYLVQVKGFADSSGNAAMNEKLSMERAQGVVSYLLQNCNVPLTRIVAPGAMGETNPAAPNETKEGRAENRRVEVKVLVNRGLAAGS
jgi:outer membrane protein OmpA-like peptidoglycan-associated protein